jgi:hypothetical protein
MEETRASNRARCAALNSAFYRMVNFEQRRQVCNATPDCVFSGRAVTGRCWTLRDLAVHESEIYQQQARDRRRRLSSEEEQYESDPEIGNESYSRRKYFQREGEKLFSGAQNMTTAGFTKSTAGVSKVLHKSSEVKVQHIDDTFRDDDDEEEESESGDGGGGGNGGEKGGGTKVNVKGALKEIGREVRSELKASIATTVAGNIAAQNEETKRLAVALVTGTLADPDLPKKVASIIADFSNKENVKRGAAGAMATSVVSTQWLYDLTLPLLQRQLHWWLTTDDQKGGWNTLRKQTIGLAKWLLPSEAVTANARWLLIQQLDPKTGYINDPLVKLVASSLYPGQLRNMEWAMTTSLHDMLRDVWYKDYIKQMAVDNLAEMEGAKKNKSKKKNEKKGDA